MIPLGWAGTRNGDLIGKAEEAGFEVLVTFDDGIPIDHDISKRSLAVYVVQPEGQGVQNTRALIGEILTAMDTYEPGQVRTFTNRTRKPGP